MQEAIVCTSTDSVKQQHNSIWLQYINLTHVTGSEKRKSKTIGTEHLMQLSLVRLLGQVWR